MLPKTTRVAISTTSDVMWNGYVSPVFAKAKTFTFVELKSGKVRDAKVISNPASSFQRGKGPIVVSKLASLGVEAVICEEFGKPLAERLNKFGIKMLRVKPKTTVVEALKRYKLLA